MIINLEEVQTIEDTSGATPDEPNNLVTLAQVVTDQPDPETLRLYQQVVVAVRGGLTQYQFESEATSLLRRISRSAPRMATFQTIRAVVSLLHGGWSNLRACRKASSPSNFKVWKRKLRPLVLALTSTPGSLPLPEN